MNDPLGPSLGPGPGDGEDIVSEAFVLEVSIKPRAWEQLTVEQQAHLDRRTRIVGEFALQMCESLLAYTTDSGDQGEYWKSMADVPGDFILRTTKDILALVLIKAADRELQESDGAEPPALDSPNFAECSKCGCWLTPREFSIHWTHGCDFEEAAPFA